MKRSEREALLQLNEQQLHERLKELRQELFNLRLQYATRQLTNTARLGIVRKDIARVLTRLRQLELARTGGRR